MVSGIWGKKIGMTQLFSGDNVVPVTAIDVSNWVITGLKTKERDGYNAIQIGCLRKRYIGQKPNENWVKKAKQYFSDIREVKVNEFPEGIVIGKSASLYQHVKEGDLVNVFGTSKGKGFTGVVKRWDFGGPPATHGATMGKKTGSLSFMRAQGRVIKGKRMAGHMGVESHAVKNLNIVKIADDAPIIFVRGAVPGHKGSLVYVQRQVK